MRWNHACSLTLQQDVTERAAQVVIIRRHGVECVGPGLVGPRVVPDEFRQVRHDYLIVHRWILAPSAISVWSAGHESPIEKACDTIRVPGFSSVLNRGMRFSLSL